jgi:hypothetical protein
MDEIVLFFILLKKRNLEKSQDVEIPKRKEMEEYIASKSISPSFKKKQELYLTKEKKQIEPEEINLTIKQLFDYEIEDDFAFKVTQHIIRDKMSSEEIHSLLSDYLETESEKRKMWLNEYRQFLSLLSKAPTTDRTYYFFSDGSFFRSDISTLKKKELIEIKHIIPLEIVPQQYTWTKYIFRVKIPERIRLIILPSWVYVPPSKFVVDRISSLRMTNKNVIDSVVIFDLIFVGYY